MNQRGVAHLFLIIVLLIGLVAAVYLAMNRTSLRSRASNETKLELSGKYLKNGKTSSHFVGVKPFYDSGHGSAPTYFRLANSDTGLEQGVVFPYQPDDSKRQPSFWSLAIGDEDASPIGKRSVYVQFLVDGKWTAPIFSTVELTRSGNNFSILASCPVNGITGNQGQFNVSFKWDEARVRATGADKLVMSIYNHRGQHITDINNIDPSDFGAKFRAPSLVDGYMVYSIGLKDGQVMGSGEYGFACGSAERQISFQKPAANCDGSNCTFNWGADGQPQLTEVRLIAQSTLDSNFAYSSTLVNGQSLQKAIGTNDGQIQSGAYAGYELRAVKLADDVEAAALIPDAYTTGPRFATQSQPAQTEVSTPTQAPIADSGVSCRVQVTPGGAGTQKVTYSGVGGKVRLWLSAQPAAGKQIDINQIKLDGYDILREFTTQETGSTNYYYELTHMDGSTSPVSQTHDLALPSGQYNLHCDVLVNNNGCTGKLSCQQENKGGNINCAAQGFPSCSANDNTSISN